MIPTNEKERLPSAISRSTFRQRGSRFPTISGLPTISGSRGLASSRISQLSLGPGGRRASIVCEWASKRFGGEVSEELAASLCHNFTFDGMKHLRRGVKLSKVMQGCSNIFASSEGKLAHYDMSEQTERLQYFLSHNWSMSRWHKHLALCFTFNFDLAFAVGFLLVILLSLLASFELAPIRQDRELKIPATMLCRSVLAPVLTCTLLFGSNIRSCLGISNPMVFLDKVCIHQTDAQEKTNGIAKLGAFLDCSDRMVILYSDVYLRKLWTIYEVANFLSLRSIFAMDVVPEQLPIVIFAALPSAYLYTTSLMVWRFSGYENPLGLMQYFIVSCFSAGFMMFLRKWARDKVRTKVQLLEFDLGKCMCAVEADREIIYGKIADLMRVVHPDLRTASTTRALEAFNAVVRLRMPTAFDLIFGVVTLRYRHFLFIALLMSGVHSADYAVFIGRTRRNVLCYWLQDAVWFFSLWPAILIEAEILASSLLWIRRFELLWACFSVFLIVIPFGSIHIGLKELETRCDDDLYFALFVAITCSTIIGTWVFVAVHEAYRASAGRDLDSVLPEFEGSPENSVADTDRSKQWVDHFFLEDNEDLQLAHV